MAFDELRVSDHVSAGAWLASRLEGGCGAVSQTIPTGFAAYARICHPATDGAGRLTTWPEVARQTGRQAHPLMQWHALVGSADSLNMTGSLWPGGDPQRGNLVPEVLAPLCHALADHTATPERCFFCLWEGWGWIDGGSFRPVGPRRSGSGAAPDSSDEPPFAPAFSSEELQRPRLRLPDRDHLLLAGPLDAALQIADPYGPAAFAAQSPNLFWPADRAWCVASEIDFDSTLLGGTPELVAAILDAPAFDSWPLQPGDSLTYDADQINAVR